MIKFALLYYEDDRGINGRHWKRNNHRFFQEELPQHPEISMFRYPINGGFDCNVIADADVVMLWSLMKYNVGPMMLRGFEDLKAYKIARAPDAWQIDGDYNKDLKKYGIDLLVSFQSPNCQYTYLEEEANYQRFILGIDQVTYKCLHNWEDRKNEILSSGVLTSDNSWKWFYRFRTECARSSLVTHVNKSTSNEYNAEYLGTDYWRLLSRYKAAIACMSFTSVLKYFEIPMSGCLMFAEVTELNQIEELGFEDGVNCIYIDKGNYKERFQEFLDSPNNPKWKKIADAGRSLVLENYTNRKEVDRFVNYIKKSLSNTIAR